MKIIIKGAVIDMDHFENYYLQPDFNVICFVVRRDIADHGMQIPLVFRSREGMKEAFCRMNAGRYNSSYSVSLSDLDCEWQKEVASRVEEYAGHMLDFDRPVNI